MQQDRRVERSRGELYRRRVPDSLQQTAFLAWRPPPPVPDWIDQLPQGSSQRRPGQVIVTVAKSFDVKLMVD